MRVKNASAVNTSGAIKYSYSSKKSTSELDYKKSQLSASTQCIPLYA